MRKRSLLTAAMLTLGTGVAAALFWLLLQVPESSVGALIASAVLALATIAVAGVTIATAIAVWRATEWKRAVGSSWRSLPLFLLGLVVFAALWWLSAEATTWWTVHRGELDALALRYLRTDRTSFAHALVTWLFWLLPWGPGLSVLGGLTAAGQLPSSPVARVRAGLRTGIAVVPVLSTTIAVLAFTQGVWRLAYWRPAGLPPSAAEFVFVAVKLAMIYGAFVALVTLSLASLAPPTDRAASTPAH